MLLVAPEAEAQMPEAEAEVPGPASRPSSWPSSRKLVQKHAEPHEMFLVSSSRDAQLGGIKNSPSSASLTTSLTSTATILKALYYGMLLRDPDDAQSARAIADGGSSKRASGEAAAPVDVSVIAEPVEVRPSRC